MKHFIDKNSYFRWGICITATLSGILLVFLGQELFGGVIAAFGMGWGLNTWYTRQIILNPFKEVTARAEQILLRNSALLTDSLISLAQGKLTTHLELQAEPLPEPDLEELKPIVQLLNSLQLSFEGSAKEYNSLTDEPCQRLLYVGADTYLEGRVCAEMMAQLLGGKGNILIYSIDFFYSSVTLRVKGFEGLLREKYPGMRIIGKFEKESDPEEAYQLTYEFLQRHPQVDGIYVSEGANPAGVARAVAEAGLAGKIKIISHDLVNETMHYISQGIITATLGQDPFAQGHEPVIHLFNHLVAGWRPDTPRLLTHQDVITQENYRQFWQEGVGIVESKGMSERRAKPVKAAVQPIRIAVLGRNDSPFWEPVRTGVMAAAEELRPFNATVEWLIPEPERKVKLQARIQCLETCVQQGYHAIVLDLHDQRLVHPVNRAVARGIPVAVYNSEPSSLRGLIALVSGRAKSLLQVSQELAAAAQKLGGEQNTTLPSLAKAGSTPLRVSSKNGTSIVQEITQAVDEVTADAQDQARAVENVTLAIDQITEAIAEVVHNIHAVTQAASSSAVTARQGTQTVQQILHQIRNIQEAVEITAEAVVDMNKFSRNVGEINETIKELTDQTGLLSLNASIVAAGAQADARGFTVIANEIRGLAEQSAVATKEVGSVLNSAQRSIQSATQSLEATTQRVKEGSQLASASGLALDELTTSAEAMQQQTLPLVSTSAAVNDSIQRLIEANKRVSAVIAENITATRKISATIQELAAQTRQVSHSAMMVAGIARELEGSIAVFQIDDN
jgi:ABC-type sugar transport system substrate-binding protein